jgi:hypothetical protein
MSGGCYRIMTVRELEQMAPGRPSADAQREVRDAAQRAVRSTSGRSNQAKDLRPATAQDLKATLSTLADLGMVGAAQKILRNAVYNQKAIGDLGQSIAQEVLEETLDLKVTAFKQTNTGYDLVMKSASDSMVVVEVKTSETERSFGSKLGDGYGARQGSEEWLRGVAQNMLHHGTANRAIAETILADPGSVPVLGVQVNPETGLADIYVRGDADGREWISVVRGLPVQ